MTPPELAGGTFTVSNLCKYGTSTLGAAISSPQAALLAVRSITEMPIVRAGELTTARLMSVTLGCDRRVLGDADGTQFLDRIGSLLEEPRELTRESG